MVKGRLGSGMVGRATYRACPGSRKRTNGISQKCPVCGKWVATVFGYIARHAPYKVKSRV